MHKLFSSTELHTPIIVQESSLRRSYLVVGLAGQPVGAGQQAGQEVGSAPDWAEMHGARPCDRWGRSAVSGTMSEGSYGKRIRQDYAADRMGWWSSGSVRIPSTSNTDIKLG